MYRCPSMGFRVQGYSVEETMEANANDYLTVLCVICQQIHILDPVTGGVLGEEDEEVPLRSN